jgi:hypothetical protein
LSANHVLALAVAASLVILALERRVYWRSFEDDEQESLTSYFAYGFAAANAAPGVLPSVVAHTIDLRRSEVRPWPHWPNGFFLLFEGVLRLFGRTESVGRSFAIAGNFLAFVLVLASLEHQDRLVAFALPWILLSFMGRDAVPFVFLDVALHFWVGFLLWWTARPQGGGDAVFRAALAAALVSNHLVAVYALPVILLRWFENRRTRALIWDLLTLGAAAAGILLALIAAKPDFSSGWEEMQDIVQERSVGSLGALYVELCRDVILGLNLEPVSVFALAAAWGVVAAAKRWRTALLLPCFLLLSLILRQYVIVHNFSRLLFVFFGLITVTVATGVIADRLGRRIARPRLLLLGRLLVLGFLAFRSAGAPQRYRPDPGVQATRQALFRLLENPETASELARCNAFRFQTTGHYAAPHRGIGQFLFGLQVLDRLRQGEPIRRCLVDLPQGRVYRFDAAP